MRTITLSDDTARAVAKQLDVPMPELIERIKLVVKEAEAHYPTGKPVTIK